MKIHCAKDEFVDVYSLGYQGCEMQDMPFQQGPTSDLSPEFATFRGVARCL